MNLFKIGSDSWIEDGTKEIYTLKLQRVVDVKEKYRASVLSKKVFKLEVLLHDVKMHLTNVMPFPLSQSVLFTIQL